MWIHLRTAWSTALCLSLLAGCAPSHWAGAPTFWRGDAEPALPLLEEPPEIYVDFATAPGTGEVEAVLGPAELPPPAGYLALDPLQCQELAAARSTPANLLAAEAGIAGGRPSQILCLYAAHLRNNSTGAALELFYRLAETELLLRSSSQSIGQLDDAIDQLEELRRRGLPAATTTDQLYQQKLQLLNQRLELQLAQQQIHGQLAALLGTPYQQSAAIWPVVELRVAVEPVDLEAAVVAGLAQRGDLRALRLLASAPDSDLLPLARQVLSSQVGMAGISRSPRLFSSLIGGHHLRDELQQRRAQVEQLLIDRERSAAQEIRLAALTVITRIRQVGLARDAWENGRQRTELLEQQRQVGQASFEDLLEARLQEIELEAELIRQLIGYQIALVKLRQAQGFAHCYQHTDEQHTDES